MSFLNLAITVVTLAFVNSGTSTPAFTRAAVVAPPTSTWSGKSGDLSVNLILTQAEDSIFGRGSYQVASAKRIGCGGESLPASGLFTMRAKGNLQSFRGRFLFDAGWTPPVTSARTNPGEINVSIHSVDRGVCVLRLHRRPNARRPSYR